MRFFTLGLASIGITPSVHQDTQKAIKCLNRPTPLTPQLWSNNNLDQYLGQLSIPFRDYVNLHDQGSIIEPCQPNLNETDWMFFQAVENYVRYADGLMNEINLLEQNKGVEELNQATQEVKISSQVGYPSSRLVKRAPASAEVVAEAAKSVSQTAEPSVMGVSRRIWNSKSTPLLSEQLVPGASELKPLPNLFVRMARYFAELGRATKERISRSFERYGLVGSKDPVPVHAKTKPPALREMSGEYQKLINDRNLIETSWMETYSSRHRHKGQHDPNELERMSNLMIQSKSSWNEIDQKLKQQTQSDLNLDASKILETYHQNLKQKNQDLESIQSKLNQKLESASQSEPNPIKPSAADKAKAVMQKFSPTTKKSTSSSSDPSLSKLQKQLEEVQDRNIFPILPAEPQALPKIKISTKTLGQAFDTKQETPEIPPPRISFNPTQLLNTRSANLAYEMNVIQNKWIRIFDRVARYEASSAVTQQRVDRVKELSLRWNELNLSHSQAIKQEALQAILDQRKQKAQKFKKELKHSDESHEAHMNRLTAEAKSSSDSLEKLKSKYQHQKIQQLEKSLEANEAERVRLAAEHVARRERIEKALGEVAIPREDRLPTTGPAPKRLRRRTLPGWQEVMSFKSSGDSKDTTLDSLSSHITRTVTKTFLSDINACSDGLASVLKDGRFVSTAPTDQDHLRMEAERLRDVFENGSSLRQAGVCVNYGTIQHSGLKKRSHSGCSHQDYYYWLQTKEGQKLEVSSDAMIELSINCDTNHDHHQNSLSKQRWEVFTSCRLALPICS